MDRHEATETCFDNLDLAFWFDWVDSWDKPGPGFERCQRRTRTAFEAFHLYAASHGRRWGWGRPFPVPSADPVDAAFHDGWEASQRWTSPFRRREAPEKSRDLVKPEDRAVYSKTLGLIAHAIQDSLAFAERMHEQAQAAVPTS